VEVFAYGSLNHYGPHGAFNPEKTDGRRCSTCKTPCTYFTRHFEKPSEILKNYYATHSAENFAAEDGYFPDRCIFDSDIDTWDTFSLSVRYSEGAMMSYSLNASTPYEGYRLAINGSHGRLESDSIHADSKRSAIKEAEEQKIRLFPIFKEMQIIEPPALKGGHGGGDPLLLEEIFVGRNQQDRTSRYAGSHAGAMAVLTGRAAILSMQREQPVKISELL